MCSRLSPVEQEQEQERQNSAQHSPVPFNEAAEHSPVPFKEAADTAARQQNSAQGKRSFQAEEEEVAVCSPLSPAAAEEEHSPLSLLQGLDSNPTTPLNINHGTAQPQHWSQLGTYHTKKSTTSSADSEDLYTAAAAAL